VTNPWRVINAIKQVDSELQRTLVDTDNAVRQTSARAERVESQLNRVQETIRRRIRQNEQRLRDCLARENSDCSSWVNAIQEDTTRLKRLGLLEEQLHSERSRIRRVTETKERVREFSKKASGWLHKRQAALGVFALNNQGWTGSVGANAKLRLKRSGTAASATNIDAAYTLATEQDGGHGSKYQSARQQFLKQVANDPNQPRYIRGWLRQEIQLVENGRRTTLRNPKGMDVGHRFAGIDTIINFRLEDASVNRARPHIARRLGIRWLR
jgi:TolA-binding protein